MMSTKVRTRVGQIVLLGLLLGVALVTAVGLPAPMDYERIVTIGPSEVEAVRAQFIEATKREPTNQELQRALDEHVQDELLFREALARGYHRDDPVVRAAMLTRMQQVAEMGARNGGYSVDEVRAYYSLRRDQYGQQLAEVRERVLADMAAEEQSAAVEQLYQEIARQYRVVYEAGVVSAVGRSPE